MTFLSKRRNIYVALQSSTSQKIMFIRIIAMVVVEALCYKPEGRGFESR
jgi:hypothetical protein